MWKFIILTLLVNILMASAIDCSTADNDTILNTESTDSTIDCNESYKSSNSKTSGELTESKMNCNNNNDESSNLETSEESTESTRMHNDDIDESSNSEISDESTESKQEHNDNNDENSKSKIDCNDDNDESSNSGTSKGLVESKLDCNNDNNDDEITDCDCEDIIMSPKYTTVITATEHTIVNSSCETTNEGETSTEGISTATSDTRTTTDTIMATTKATDNTQLESAETTDDSKTSTTDTITETMLTTTEECITTTEVPQCSDALAQIQRTVVELTSKILYEIVISNQQKTVAASGITLLLFVALLKLYALNETNSDLSKDIKVYDNDKVRCALIMVKEYTQKLPPGSKYYVENDVAGNYTFSKSFEQDIKRCYNGQTIPVDFENQEKSTNDINAVVKFGTNNFITDVIPSKYLVNSTTQLVNVIGIAIKVPWQKTFDPKLIKERSFTVTLFKYVRIPYYYQKGIFNYTENAKFGFKAVQIPIKGGSYESVLVILPNTIFGFHLLNIIKAFGNPDTYFEVMKSMTAVMVEFYYPVFNVTTPIDTRDILKKIKFANSILDPKTAQFEGITQDKHNNIFLSLGRQKIAIISDYEEELQQSTEQESISPKKSSQKVYQVDCNHPFIFYYIVNGFPIAAGVYANNNTV